MARVRNGKHAKMMRKEQADAFIEGPKPSPQEQIEVLDARLGVGVGAVKERARLAKLVG